MPTAFIIRPFRLSNSVANFSYQSIQEHQQVRSHKYANHNARVGGWGSIPFSLFAVKRKWDAALSAADRLAGRTRSDDAILEFAT